MHWAPEYLFAIIFPVYWVFVLWLIAKFGGWAKLADKYGCEPSFAVSWTGWQSGKIGMTNYKSCLWLAATAEGLYIKPGPAFLFGLWHPPIRIPWSAISSAEERNLLWTRSLVIKLTDSNTQITLYGQALPDGQRYLGDKLKLLEKRK